MHRRIIISHNLATEIRKRLTQSKIHTSIAFHWDTSSNVSIWRSFPPAKEELSPCLSPNPICAWKLARHTICTGKSSRVQPISYSCSVTNQALWWVQWTLCIGMTVVSRKPATFDYFLVEKSLAASVIVWGQYQESSKALHMWSAMVRLQSCLVGGWQQPEPSIRPSHTSYISHGSSQLRHPILVVSICQASLVSAEISACISVLLWWLHPSPSQVRHHRSGSVALYLLHHRSRLPHPPHHWNFQDQSDCLW